MFTLITYPAKMTIERNILESLCLGSILWSSRKKKWRKQTTDQRLKLWRFTELYFSELHGYESYEGFSVCLI